MTFEQWVASEPEIFIPDDVESAQKPVEMGMKAAFEAGRASAEHDMSEALRGIETGQA